MAQRIWQIHLEDGEHTVELQHGYISGRRKIFIDDEQLDLPPTEAVKLMDNGSVHHFMIGDHHCEIRIQPNGFAFSYDLLVDGMLMSRGAGYSPTKDGKSPDGTRHNEAIVFTFFSVIFLFLLFVDMFIVTRFLVMLFPVLLFFAVYYWLFTEDPSELTKQLLGHIFVLIGMSVIWSFVGLWLLETKQYFTLIRNNRGEFLVGVFLWVLILFVYLSILKRKHEKNKESVLVYFDFDDEVRDNLAKKIEPVFDQIEDSWFSPTVSLEEFFEGNNDSFSIAANLWPQHPSVDEFFSFLKNIREKDEVQDVLIGIRMVEEGEWPYSDTIFVISSAPIEMIQDWFTELRPDAVEFCGPSSDSFRPYPFPELNADMQVVLIWWD